MEKSFRKNRGKITLREFDKVVERVENNSYVNSEEMLSDLKFLIGFSEESLRIENRLLEQCEKLKVNKINKKELLQWLKNKKNYAEGHLKNEDILDYDYRRYAIQNGILSQIIDKIQSGGFNS